MGDNHGGAVAVSAFPIAPYVYLISYLSQALVPFADLLNVLASLYIVKLTSTLSVLKYKTF
jgi:hypothetical protein